jgi:predicted GH43/DUF377 family glycosyl hydrolase
MLKRFKGNPIIEPGPDKKWFTKKAYNAAVISREGKYYLLFRGVADDWISRIMLAESSDGINFVIEPDPVIIPENEWEKMGCEDPRVIYLNGRYWVTYTAFDGKTARAAIASSTDMRHWEKHNLLFPNLAHPQRENLPGDWSKAAAIIPQLIDEHYLLLFGDNHIWSATSTNLINWTSSSVPIIGARPNYFDSAYVEMGPPPIRTDRGWLAFYNGINDFTEKRIYCIGAALLDLNNPLKVIWRCSKPIISPQELYEKVGFVDMVPGGYSSLKNMSVDDIDRLYDKNDLAEAVFCCGSVLEDANIRLYYGAADTRICTATVDLETIFNS